MSVNKNTNIKTVVRFVYILVIALTLVYATAYAEPAAPANKPAGNSTAPAPGYQILPPGGYPIYTESPEQRCSKLKDELKTVRKKVSETCGEPKECARKMKACLGAPQTSQDAAAIMAQIFGKSTSEVRQNCTDTPSSYESKRKSYQDKIESLGKEIRSLEKDDADIDERYQEKVVKLQEAFAKEQKDLETLQEEIDSKNMEEEKNALDEDQKAAANLSKLMEAKMQLRNELSTATVKAQSAMIEASEEISRGDCIAQVKKFKKEMKSGESTRASSAGDLIGSGNSLRKQLETRFNACMEIMTLRRKEIGRELSEKVAAISFKMDENAQQIQQLEDYNKKSAEQREKRAQLMVDKKQKAIKASVQKTQQIQGQLAQEGELAKKKHASVQKAQGEVNQFRNKANTDLISLGIMDPAKGSSSDTDTNKDVAAAYELGTLENEYTKTAECCAGEKAGADPLCGGVTKGLKPKGTYKKTGGNE